MLNSPLAVEVFRLPSSLWRLHELGGGRNLILFFSPPHSSHLLLSNFTLRVIEKYSLPLMFLSIHFVLLLHISSMWDGIYSINYYSTTLLTLIWNFDLFVVKFASKDKYMVVINRYFFSKATRETSLFTHLPFDYSNARFFRIVSCRLWTCPITRTGFCAPPSRITTEEYRSHYAAVSRNLHVTFSCIFPRDLSAGTFKLLTKKKEEK